MQSHTSVHDSHFGFHWSPARAALTVMLTLLFLIFLFLFMSLTAPPAQAQSGVPATAREAAAMPQFAAKLARTARSTAPVNASRVPKPAKLERRDRPAPPACSQAPVQPHWLPDDDGVLYSNGPINGNTDAWTINFGFAVSDTFTTDGSQITGLQFGAWLFPGDVLQRAEVLIGSSEYANDLFDQTVNFTQSGNCPINTYGYAICTESSSFTPNVGAGTVWVTLQNAVVNNGDPLYWDENEGPSLASENSVGTIPSEAFTVLGDVCPPWGCPPPPPPPPSCFHGDDHMQIIHDFTSNEGQANGVTVDKAGNVYGTTTGGDSGAGMVYKLAQRGGNWLFAPVYTFTGGYNGGSPSPVIVGPDGALYGTAAGGDPSCNCGLVFRLRPSPVAPPTALSGWQEEVLYRFTGGSDGSSPNGILTFDDAGNLYGVAGAQIYELTPSPGGWTEKILYTFQGGSDGGAISGLVAGRDGNLYGTTTDGGGYGYDCGWCGTVFQLVPASGGWIENKIYLFEDQGDGYGPRDLFQDSSGNLYGHTRKGTYDGMNCYYYPCYAVVFELSPSSQGWVFSVLSGGGQQYVWSTIPNFTTDGKGNFYHGSTTRLWVQGQCGWWWFSGGIAMPGGGWGTYDLFEPNGPLAVGSSHVYGTTSSCGSHGSGTVWSVSH